VSQYRVLTLNMHKGFSMTNWKFTLERIRECLRQSESTIVFLQEVIGENLLHQKSINNWPEKNQYEFLADSVWEHHAYGKNAIHQYGHHGNAILSELPFKKLVHRNISTHAFAQRGLLHGQLVNGVHLICVHLGLFEKERSLQTAMLIEYIQDNVPVEAPLLVAGDFNDWRQRVHAPFAEQLGLNEVHLQFCQKAAKTFPAVFPILAMDRIYLRGFSINHVELMTQPAWRDISDHCAVVADLTLLSSPP
jgi:endonuclease/exonuclease/phosphatase family metal-dependent hydrolase